MFLKCVFTKLQPGPVVALPGPGRSVELRCRMSLYRIGSTVSSHLLTMYFLIPLFWKPKARPWQLTVPREGIIQTFLKTSYTSAQHSGPHDAFESFSKLLWTFRVTSGCLTRIFRSCVCSSEYTKRTLDQVQPPDCFLSVKSGLDCLLPICEKFLCVFCFCFFTWSISWSHSWSRLAGQRMFWQECFCRLSLFLYQSVFEHILICKSVSRGRHLNWRLETFQRKGSELHPGSLLEDIWL